VPDPGKSTDIPQGLDSGRKVAMHSRERRSRRSTAVKHPSTWERHWTCPNQRRWAKGSTSTTPPKPTDGWRSADGAGRAPTAPTGPTTSRPSGRPLAHRPGWRPRHGRAASNVRANGSIGRLGTERQIAHAIATIRSHTAPARPCGPHGHAGLPAARRGGIGHDGVHQGSIRIIHRSRSINHPDR
jgi:hypothetical protein